MSYSKLKLVLQQYRAEKANVINYIRLGNYDEANKLSNGNLTQEMKTTVEDELENMVKALNISGMNMMEPVSELVNDMEKMSASSEELTATIEEVTKQAQNTSELAEKLNEMAHKFKI